MGRLARFFLIAGALSGLIACVSAPSPDSEMAADSVSEKNEKNPEQYIIGKGDILEVITWKEPDFSREVPVRIDGRISFPLLDDIQAAGRTPGQVRDEIMIRLKDFVNHPVVSVAVKASVSKRFYIIGEIAKPGEYPLIKHLTVVQAFALAGGFTEWASTKDIILIRHEAGEEKVISVNYKNIMKGEDLDSNVPLKADDIIVIP
ncbi:sugar ABC transporter substrate-binding protein [Desulfonema ishimotonii]|uniref:Sugar ABC transporter substrate-binding protein n=1 Tax=Desulfonema ishimotonii TaxID=45657 RepID=A0A401FQJ4_9BACT|nr:polysaccharide biosynthesis/export family protein [Desulfonema ishimotonii]GBC59237.1 sugar ABC transporter substrate-binding protein [Desulfonema ishimotonii]